MTTKPHNYGSFNSYDLLKFIAISTMIIDHLGLFFYPEIPLFRVIGRVSYILFIFAVGYNQKYSFDYRLLALGLLMLSFYYICNMNGFNFSKSLASSILFSIIITRWIMQYLIQVSSPHNLYYITVFLWCANLFSFPYLQYGTAGITIAICGYLIKNPSQRLTNGSIYLLVNLFLYAGFEALKMRFSLFNTAILFAEFGCLFIALKNFTIYPVHINAHYAKFLLPISRNSLIIYFVHYLIFSLASKIS